MFENQETQYTPEYTIQISSQKNKFYGLIVGTFAIALLITFALTFAFTKIFNWTASTPSLLPIEVQIGLLITFLILGIISLIVVNTKKRPIWIQLIALIFIMIFFATAFSSLIEIYDLSNSWKLLALLAAPALIMAIAGILGYFELVKIQAISVFAIILCLPLIGLLIASFFIYNATMDRLICSISLGILVLSSILNFWIIKKKADAMQFESSKEVIKEGIYWGTKCYVLYMEIAYYLIRIFGKK
ncbi:MAG0110 family membrane protein [Mycoplasmopsis gallopavonis]|uniref:Inhibitor of apoptosis-promoting Bax1 n=1 Tax=Mycoplasmopsis gallopavonis TaxID=76629 RepID=A0A449AZ70_9BACT|nr:hypothetical protein [Mycoplasmopsis gallopavonis]RIV16278.1 hypothetical protein D1113_02970 [Mycoplasmopsis gallopavonis]VEU72756.1 Uncharacterised protein [Mycoplasmopsis gallopavonis]